MSDQWDWYKAAIKAKNAGKDLPPVSDGKPEIGFFYAKASKAGGRIPVCIYRDSNGDLVARSGTRAEHKIEDAGARWTWVAGSPIERDNYVHAWEQGVWPDGTPTTAPAAGVGDNRPSDPAQAVAEEAADKIASAEKWLAAHPVIKTQQESDFAANLNRELLGLHKQATALHTTEKAPILEAERAVDEKFRFRVKVKSVADTLRAAFETFMKAEDARRRAEAQKKFEAERAKAEAERKRIEAEREKLRRDDPIAALTSDEPEMPMLPLAPEPVKIQSGGGIGAARGLKTVWVPVIVDHEAALKHYANHPEIKAAVEKLVKAEARVHKQATSIPGVQMQEDRKVA